MYNKIAKMTIERKRLEWYLISENEIVFTFEGVKLIITNGKVVLPNKIEYGKNVVIDGDRIVDFTDCKDLPKSQQVYDARGCYVCPGLVDIHTHGGFGSDFMDATEEAFNSVLSFHSSYGVTSVIATTVTAEKGQVIKMLDVAKKVMGKTPSECRLLGVHLEGPYLSAENRGAHLENLLKVPANDDYSYVLDYKDVIKTVTVSPELDGATEMIKKLSSVGILCSGGHDNAILPQILKAKEAGLSHLTHIYCAMSGVVMKNGKRYVGLREYGLIDDDMTAEMIADNHHITPELAKLIYRCKGADKCCVVSDSLRVAGFKEDGKLYQLGNGDGSQLVKISDGVAVVADGRCYAGGIQPVSMMVKNLIKDCDISVVDAVKMASLTPAKIIGANDVGAIEVGKKADFCIMDENFNVIDVIFNGQLKERRKNVD